MGTGNDGRYEVLEDWLEEKNELWALVVLKRRGFLYELLKGPGCRTPFCSGVATHARSDGFSRAHDPRCEYGVLLRALGGTSEVAAQITDAHDLALRGQGWFQFNRPVSETPPMYQGDAMHGYVGVTGPAMTGASGPMALPAYPFAGMSTGMRMPLGPVTAAVPRFVAPPRGPGEAVDFLAAAGINLDPDRDRCGDCGLRECECDETN